MRFKGREALFFVIGFVVIVGAVWRFYPRSRVPAHLPDLWIFYARATTAREVLYARRYSPRGKALSRPIRVGPLALVQETEVASSGPDGLQWVTTGTMVRALGQSRVVKTIPAPAGFDVVSLKSIAGQLYAVAESIHGSAVEVERWNGRSWTRLQSSLRLGITTLASGPHGSVWVLVADPTRAEVQEVWPAMRTLTLRGAEPQGTLGFGDGAPVLTYAYGENGFGWWNGRRHSFRSVYQAVVSVANSAPLWGLGVRGMIPFHDGRFNLAGTVPWPGREITTPQALGHGPWIAVMDGFSQGRWFNIDSGRFGPSFQIKTPWWAVVRAASLGS